MRDAVLGGPRVHRQADALIRLDNDVAAIDAEHHSAHAIDEANGLVEVLREKNAGAAVDGHLHGGLGHHLAMLEVVHIALGAGTPTHGQEEGVRGFRQDVGHVFLARLRVHDVARPLSRRCLVAGLDLPQLLLRGLANPQELPGLPPLCALAAQHSVQLSLLHEDTVPQRRVQGTGRVDPRQLVEVADEDQGRKALGGLPLLHMRSKIAQDSWPTSSTTIRS